MVPSFNIVNGEKTPSSKTRTVSNPATGEPIAEIAVATPAHLDAAVEAATKAFPAWSRTPLEARRKIVRQLGDMLKENLQAFVNLVVQEVGKSQGLAWVSWTF